MSEERAALIREVCQPEGGDRCRYSLFLTFTRDLDWPVCLSSLNQFLCQIISKILFGHLGKVESKFVLTKVSIFSCPAIGLMIRDQYANYVVQVVNSNVNDFS